MSEFYLPPTGGLWKRRGHLDVPPGAYPDDPSQPTAFPRLQVARLSLSSVTVPQPGTGGWPGDPGNGNYLIGWSAGPNGNATIATADDNAGWPVGKVSLFHNYSGNSNGVDTAKLDEAIARNMIPSQSFKMQNFRTNIGPGTNYDTTAVANGSADAQIDASANACLARAPWPILLCYTHEPESNFTTAATMTTYRASYRRIVTRFRARGVTNVTWMPIFMNPYTFSSGSGRDWRNYHADWTGTGWNSDIMMDICGMDTYCPLPWPAGGAYPDGPWYTAGRNFYTFPELWASAKSKIELPGYPVWDYVVPEFGMSNAFDTDPNWLPWGTQARDFAKANRIKAFSYWDNSDDLGRWSFVSIGGSPDPDANGTKIQGWNAITNAASVWSTPTGQAPIG